MQATGRSGRAAFRSGREFQDIPAPEVHCSDNEVFSMASEAIETLIGILDTFSEHRLRNRVMLARLLEHGGASGKTAEVGELAFQGNYLTRLLGTIRAQPPGGEHMPKLEEEYARALHSFVVQLERFLAEADNNLRASIAAQYLQTSEASLRHLVDLAADFGWLKNWEVAAADAENSSGA
jgi:hypothetical protein